MWGLDSSRLLSDSVNHEATIAQNPAGKFFFAAGYNSSIVKQMGGEAMSKHEMVDVNIMVQEGYKDKLSSVARDLKAKGFILNESLKEIGILQGSAPAASIESLSNVAGVSAVEKNRSDYRTQ